MLLADGVNSNPASASVKPDQQAADQRTGHRAQPAGNDNDESQQRIGRSDHRRHVDDQGHDHAGGADASGADAEGQRVKPVDVEPDDQRAGIIIGAGADRLAGEA